MGKMHNNRFELDEQPRGANLLALHSGSLAAWLLAAQAHVGLGRG